MYKRHKPRERYCTDEDNQMSVGVLKITFELSSVQQESKYLY